jgi:chorismate mutase type II
LDTQREQIILEKVANSVQEKQYEDTLVQTFSDLLKHSRAYQERHI